MKYVKQFHQFCNIKFCHQLRLDAQLAWNISPSITITFLKCHSAFAEPFWLTSARHHKKFIIKYFTTSVATRRRIRTKYGWSFLNFKWEDWSGWSILIWVFHKFHVTPKQEQRWRLLMLHYVQGNINFTLWDSEIDFMQSKPSSPWKWYWSNLNFDY